MVFSGSAAATPGYSSKPEPPRTDCTIPPRIQGGGCERVPGWWTATAGTRGCRPPTGNCCCRSPAPPSHTPAAPARLPRHLLGGRLARPDGWKRWLTVTGAGPRPSPTGPVLGDAAGCPHPGTPLSGTRSQQITRAYVGSFFALHPRGKQAPRLDGPKAADPEVVFHRS